jgi:hypothetical protein
MAVVIHGSFDEGPVVLALPPTFEFTGNETDPIFTAWDRSTGIAITASQVTDFDTEVANNSAVVANTAKVSYPSADAAKLAGIAAGATNVDSALLVPYTGASGDVDLGVHNLAVGKVTIDNTPTDPTDAATVAYVDSVVTSGISWKAAVIDILDTLPVSDQVDGDRYILSSDNHIKQWDSGGSTWTDITPTTGDTVFVISDVTSPTNSTGTHVFNGTTWVYSGTTIKHNDTTDKEGGGGGHYYHLSAATTNTVSIITTTGADSVPTGLRVENYGINTGTDGTQTAFVELYWDAISTDTFDHYHLLYKKTENTYYTPLDCKTNSVVIEGLTAGKSYDFKVASVNKYGTLSDFCTVVTQVMANDTQAPDTVENVSAVGGIQYVIIEWDANDDYDLASYDIYRNTSNSHTGEVLVGNTRSTYFVDGNRIGLQEYFYWVKAIDTSGNASTSYSTVASATPRNVTTDDIVTISGSKVLINGSIYLSNWQKVGDLTKIDGGSISANTITTTQLNFTPVQGTNVIAKINASTEGIQIEADNFTVSGSTVFTKKLGGSFDSSDSVPRIRIFPSDDPETALQIIDNDGNDVFKAIIGGTNVGDVIIGNWAEGGAGSGIFYNKDLHSTSFAGTIYASAGSISGLLDFGTATAVVGGLSQNVAIKGPDIWENAYTTDNSAIHINRIGYNGGTDYFRKFLVYDGKGNVMFEVQPSTDYTNIYSKLQVYDKAYFNDTVDVSGGLAINTTTGALTVPRMSLAQATAISSKVDGMICWITDTPGHGAQLCVYYNSQWNICDRHTGVS